ncbi:sarcosine oxidase subunit gamma family protein [Xinfangfangia sp. CPCC 101601]|uniref:Sarcosine oxidase subunit gamma family protein n=1 Tax=Pseudogemmobacter lacusdianii TaxID=3069608 RepID=A0ABU0VVF3_9RHOB|nr:sarcosine oxidase subunit gamma family protein [Xinfangfangia sp. CPCC 101601]MDQ2065717.1 sarcosine oxidase subunit gamma family protein [Xinfangfangia sp. CPCC 101601]
MPELIAKSAIDAGPVTKGGASLALMEPGPISSIALYAHGAEAGAKGLETLGLSFPAPGQSQENGAARILWTGRDQAFLIGAEAPAMEGAAITDQSDGWAAFSLSGAGVEDVLSRLVAVDVRLSAFAPGQVVRTGLNHMPMILRRASAEAFEIYTFRSMARSAWHELEEVMGQLAARGTLKS